MIRMNPCTAVANVDRTVQQSFDYSFPLDGHSQSTPLNLDVQIILFQSISFDQDVDQVALLVELAGVGHGCVQGVMLRIDRMFCFFSCILKQVLKNNEPACEKISNAKSIAVLRDLSSDQLRHSDRLDVAIN